MCTISSYGKQYTLQQEGQTYTHVIHELESHKVGLAREID